LFITKLHDYYVITAVVIVILLVDWCLTALSAQAGYIVPQEYEIYDEGPGDETNTQ